MAPLGGPPNVSRFNAAVWDIVRRIPFGRVASYGQIAKLVGLPEGVDVETYRAFGARWVGAAMSACPPDVPWQRVLNAKGEISLKGDAQRRLLEAEGVQFDAKGRVDLKRFGWEGPDAGEQPGLFGAP
jgi:methylated-DNA-protein-cysteine methyltransferase-like protein